MTITGGLCKRGCSLVIVTFDCDLRVALDMIDCILEEDVNKNDIVWTFVELVANQLLDEFETTMIEYEQEISDTYGDQLYNMRSLNDHNYAQL